MKPWEEYQEGPWTEYQSTDNSSDYREAAYSGVRNLVPAIAGMPMDAAQNIVNLGKMAVGVAKGETVGGDLPDLSGPPIGGSEWIKDKINQLYGRDIHSPPDPTDPTQQKIHMASGIMGAGLLAPAQGIKQVAANVGKMAIPAGGAVTGKTIAPDQPLAPMIGMMAAPTAVGALKSGIPPSRAFMKAHKLGYKVPPSLVKPTKTQQFAEGTAGPVPTKQKASIQNQSVTNELIKKEIGYPKDIPLSREGLQGIRAEAGKVYEQAKNLGTFTVDKNFTSQIKGIAKQGSTISKEFPGLIKKDVAKMVKNFTGKKTISAESTVELIKQLRADSSVGFKSQDPATLALAKANGKMANALEGLMERNIEKSSRGFLKAFRDARQRIAKTYTVENALKGENVDAVFLGRQLDKGKPISGRMKDVAEFGQHFKGAAQINPPQQTNFRPVDIAVGVGGALSAQNPAYLLAMGARPSLRTLLLSKPYQNMLARVKPGALKRVMKLPESSQAAAIASLLEEFKALENEPQPNSQ